MSQDKNSTIVQNQKFGARLKEACASTKTAEIARKLEIPYQTVKNYLSGRLPAAEVLIAISSSTNVSIHWLLTGEGPKILGPFIDSEVESENADKKLHIDLPEDIFSQVKEEADGEGKTIEEIVIQLIDEAANQRAVMDLRIERALKRRGKLKPRPKSIDDGIDELVELNRKEKLSRKLSKRG